METESSLLKDMGVIISATSKNKFDFSSATKEELIKLLLKWDENLMQIHKQNKTLKNETLFVKKELDKYEDALNNACIELSKAYTKTAKKPLQKWQKSENWKTKFLKEVS